MKRSAPMKRSGFKRPSKPMARGTKRLGPGKKTKAWDAMRARVKPLFEAAGITRCELGYMDDPEPARRCKGEVEGFAHAKKRDETPPDELSHVIAACNNCHAVIERLSHAEMAERVYAVIRARETAVKAVPGSALIPTA
jgi:hypothetical protein